MTSVRKSIGYSLLSSNAVTALQFLGSLVIARLLTPEEIGVFSVAAVIVALAQIFRDLGASAYIIQVEALTTELLRAAFGIALVAGGTIGLALAGASGIIADFYAEPRVRVVMLILALNFALTPFGAVTMACVRREMGFRSLAVADSLSACVSLATSVFLAYRGYGAASLAWASVAGTLTSFLASLFLRPAYLPWRPSLKGAGAILGFGSLTTSSTILGYLNLSAADLVLGKLAGMSAVAYFNRSASLSRFFGQMLNKALGPVLLPAMSAIRRNGGDMRTAFLDGTALLTGVAWPAYAVIAVASEPLILLLFGDQWQAAVPLVPYIALTAAISATHFLCGTTYTARGTPGLNLAAEAINLPVKVLAIIFLAPHGVLAVAQGWPVIALASAAVHQILLKRAMGLTVTQLAGAVWKSAIVAACAGAGGLAGAKGAGDFATGLATGLAGVVVGAAIGGGLAMSGLNHPMWKEVVRLWKKR